MSLFSLSKWWEFHLVSPLARQKRLSFGPGGGCSGRGHRDRRREAAEKGTERDAWLGSFSCAERSGDSVPSIQGALWIGGLEI